MCVCVRVRVRARVRVRVRMRAQLQAGHCMSATTQTVPGLARSALCKVLERATGLRRRGIGFVPCRQIRQATPQAVHVDIPEGAVL